MNTYIEQGSQDSSPRERRVGSVSASILVLLGCCSFTASFSCFGQGSLNPPGPPAPTMKSLQEIWDKIGTIETTVSNQQQKISNLLSVTQEQSAYLSLILNEVGPGFLSWAITTVDSGGVVGSHTSLAFNPSGQPTISYYDDTNDDLKFAVFDGEFWQISVVDSAGNVGQYTSLAYAPGGLPSIAYYDVANGDLKYAAFGGTSWTIVTVDSVGDVGRYASLAFGPSGQPAIGYYDQTNGDLRYASFDGANWNVTTVDAAGVTGWYCSLAFIGGQPAISYYDSTNSDLRYAAFNGTTWQSSTVVGNGNVGQYTSLKARPNGLPAISYFDVTPGEPNIQSFDGSAWLQVGGNLSSIDDETPLDFGLFTSLSFTLRGEMALSFFDTTNDDLYYAYTINSGYSWTSFVVDSAGDVGRYTSLAFTPRGEPAISYFDATNGNLKYAVRGPFTQP